MTHAKPVTRPIHHPPLRRHYVRSGAIAAGLIGLALAIGIAGYHFLNEEPWLDAFVDAAMILGGMGQVAPLVTSSGKLFAGFYAILCGLIFISTAAVLVAPWLHKLLHHLHTDPTNRR
jgi:hypothetical protein